MPVEIDRAALTEQIEVAFADSRSTRERAKFLQQLPLTGAETLPYEAQEIEAVFRNRVWQNVAFDEHDQLRDLDCVTELSDEALAYYLPALMILAVSDPSWLVNHESLEHRLIGSFATASEDQLAVGIAFIEFMIQFYSYLVRAQEALDDVPTLLDIEDIEYRMLTYLDEKRVLTARQTEA